MDDKFETMEKEMDELVRAYERHGYKQGLLTALGIAEPWKYSSGDTGKYICYEIEKLLAELE